MRVFFPESVRLQRWLTLSHCLSDKVFHEPPGFHKKVEAISVPKPHGTTIINHPFTQIIQFLLVNSSRTYKIGGSWLRLDFVAWKKPNLIESEEDSISEVSIPQQLGWKQQAVGSPGTELEFAL